MPRPKKTDTAAAPVTEAAEKPVEKKEKKTAPASEAVEPAAAAETSTEEKAKRAKKAAPKKAAGKSGQISTKVVVELMNTAAPVDTLVERAKEDWVNKGNSLDSIENLVLYINASESMVYYVVNDDYLSGSFAV